MKQFRPGDEVFGWCKGAFAEHACAPEKNVLPKPANLTFEQAAAVGDSAFTALAAVRDQGQVKPGHKVLINGASGGVGTFAVQIAKSFGATGDRRVQHEECRHGPIDRRGPGDRLHPGGLHPKRAALRRDARSGGSRSLSDCRRVLTPRGTYVLVGVLDLGRWFGLARQIKALSLSPFVRQRMRVFIVRHNREDLAILKELVEAGKVTPVIDRRYELREVPEALRYQGEGHAHGKIVIAV